ncbi:hypothetical protein O6H91_10G023800 [Diphasiastrum complanatum]|uniref:Uncharacterized protein n=1 Tax=Diphasiastrum complanatum TaxID=34168 RepID=A0ACC2CF96_DIPCM|nr:hypothetical protein O6H91_10G023800 [Diphasiastrum complanatum]
MSVPSSLLQETLAEVNGYQSFTVPSLPILQKINVGWATWIRTALMEEVAMVKRGLPSTETGRFSLRSISLSQNNLPLRIDGAGRDGGAWPPFHKTGLPLF